MNINLKITLDSGQTIELTLDEANELARKLEQLSGTPRITTPFWPYTPYWERVPPVITWTSAESEDGQCLAV